MSEDIQSASADLVGRVSAKRVTRQAHAVQAVGLRCVNSIYGSCKMSGYAALTRPTGLGFDGFEADSLA